MTPTARFLSHLWPELPESQWLLIYTLPDRMSHWCTSLAEAERLAIGARNKDVYIGLGLTGQNNGPFSRAARNEITAIPGLWADLDCKADTRKKTALPATLEELLTVIPADVPPTMLVATGGGYHAYWLFHEPLILSTPAARDAAERTLKEWQTLLRRRAQVHGWTLDYTHDLPRILRVPGTANLKDPSAPRMVTITRDDGPRYDPDDFREILADNEFVDKTAGVIHADLDDRWREIPVTVALNATVDADLIDQLCQIDPRFRLTWNYDRPDITGPEGAFSEYDLAIANFGITAGLTFQTITNMMVEFRRRHGGKPKPRPDYYKRTIARAMQQGTGPAPVIGIPATAISTPSATERPTAAPPPPAPSDDAPPPPLADQAPPRQEQRQHQAPPPEEPKPAEENPYFDAQVDYRATSDSMRVKLLEMVSQWVGMRILRIVKITGREPSYVIETETARIDIEAAAKLVDQGYVRARIAAVTNLLIRRYKADEWDRMVRMMIGAVTEKDGGAELETAGEMTAILQQYLSIRGFLDNARGASPAQLRMPMVHHGAVTVNTLDLQLYLQRELGSRMTARQIAAGLSAIGAVSMRFRAGGVDQTRWQLPTHDWQPAAYGQVAEEQIA